MDFVIGFLRRRGLKKTEKKLLSEMRKKGVVSDILPNGMKSSDIDDDASLFPVNDKQFNGDDEKMIAEAIIKMRKKGKDEIVVKMDEEDKKDDTKRKKQKTKHEESDSDSDNDEPVKVEVKVQVNGKSRKNSEDAIEKNGKIESKSEKSEEPKMDKKKDKKSKKEKEDSSDEEEEEKEKKVKKDEKKKSSKTLESEDEKSESEEDTKSKKRSRDEYEEEESNDNKNGKSVTFSEELKPTTPSQKNPPKFKSNSTGNKVVNRFSRIGDPSQYLDELKVMDNSYEAVFGSGGYGAKASSALKTKVGRDFKAEKNKKKRATYMHGTIDVNAVNSVSFQ